MPYINFYLDFGAQGRPAFVPVEYMSFRDAVELVRNNGGVPVVAHPGLNLRGRERIVEKLLERGAEGLEVFNNYHDDRQIAYFAPLVRGLDDLRQRFPRQNQAPDPCRAVRMRRALGILSCRFGRAARERRVKIRIRRCVTLRTRRTSARRSGSRGSRNRCTPPDRCCRRSDRPDSLSGRCLP